MALSNAEKVRRYRERQKLKKQDDLKQPTPQGEVFKRPFFEFFPIDEQIGSQYAQSLELAGVQPILFEDDSGPEASTLDNLQDGLEDNGAANPFGISRGSSLGKAEVLIGCLLDAASDLASQVNDYKKTEIRNRIAELEKAELIDPEAKRKAFAKVAELTKILNDLEKTVRWPVPIWKVDDKVNSVKD